MVRRRSRERQIAERVVDQFLRNRRRRNNYGEGQRRRGKGGLSAVPLLLVAAMCVFSHCNPVADTASLNRAGSSALNEDYLYEENDDAYLEASDYLAPQYDLPPVAESNGLASGTYVPLMVYDDLPRQQEYDAVEEVAAARDYQSSQPSYELSEAERVDNNVSTSLDYPSTSDLPYEPSAAERVKIERVVDGDTLVVRNGAGESERVRFIGVNTPETVKPNSPIEPFGPEASNYTKQRVAEDNYIATLVSDGDKTDRYGRRLAFVYLGDDQISLNEELARKGLAKVEPQYRFSKEMKDRLLAAEEQAKAEGLGVHSLSN